MDKLDKLLFEIQSMLREDSFKDNLVPVRLGDRKVYFPATIAEVIANPVPERELPFNH